jgi:hypothetical protein
MRAFPPRLPDQPIFYPVTNEGYATQIARDWNTKAGTKAGFVTRFSVDDEYASKFERRVVGAKEHEELWVPAEELAEFNAHLEGRIEVTRAFFGDGYRGHIPDTFTLAGRDAREQFVVLARTSSTGGADLIREIAANEPAVFLNCFLWEQADFSADGIEPAARDELLAKLRHAWADCAHGAVVLGIATHRTRLLLTVEDTQRAKGPPAAARRCQGRSAHRNQGLEQVALALLLGCGACGASFQRS